MPPFRDPQQHYLLAAMPADKRERIYPALQLIKMPLGKVLYDSAKTAWPQ